MLSIVSAELSIKSVAGLLVQQVLESLARVHFRKMAIDSIRHLRTIGTAEEFIVATHRVRKRPIQGADCVAKLPGDAYHNPQCAAVINTKDKFALLCPVTRTSRKRVRRLCLHAHFNSCQSSGSEFDLSEHVWPRTRPWARRRFLAGERPSRRLFGWRPTRVRSRLRSPEARRRRRYFGSVYRMNERVICNPSLIARNIGRSQHRGHSRNVVREMPLPDLFHCIVFGRRLTFKVTIPNTRHAILVFDIRTREIRANLIIDIACCIFLHCVIVGSWRRPTVYRGQVAAEPERGPRAFALAERRPAGRRRVNFRLWVPICLARRLRGYHLAGKLQLVVHERATPRGERCRPNVV